MRESHRSTDEEIDHRKRGDSERLGPNRVPCPICEGTGYLASKVSGEPRERCSGCEGTGRAQ